MNRSRLVATALFAALAVGCAYEQAFDVSCSTEGARDGSRVCEGGVWVTSDAGAQPELDGSMGEGDVSIPSDADAPDAGPDVDADPMCVNESNVEFCARLGVNCDEVTAPDNCGDARTINCGTCDDPESCGGAGEDNVCGCEPETPAEFCTRLVKTCDDVTALDNCGVERTENCGSCTAPAVCGGGGTPNVCACPDQTDEEFCAAAMPAAVCGAYTAVDVCGQNRTTNCGMCTAPETCGAVDPNQCDCPDDAAVCAVIGVECGMADVAGQCNNKASVNCGGCQPNAMCSANTCVCEPGFTPDGLGNCEDVDECGDGTDNCDVNAMCMNTPGSFECMCNPGYQGDGTTCSDIDECAVDANNCDLNATCMNTAGSFTCTCDAGYRGTGLICDEIDECAENTDNCDANATCTNTPGSFECDCNPGYVGNGQTCMASALVVSVQTVKTSTGSSSASINLPTPINSDNAVAFISTRASDGRLRATAVDVVLNDDTIDITRSNTTGTIEVVVAVVEFDPTRVKVQSGSFGEEGAQSIDAVDRTASFLTFAAQADRNDDDVDTRMISGHFSNDAAVTFGRASTEGSMAGHFWVAEALDGGFSVQHYNGSISNTQMTFTIAAVDPARTFLLYSNQSTEQGSNLSNGVTSCRLSNATTVTCTRTGSGATLTNLHVQVVEVLAASVQRGMTTFTGTSNMRTESINAVSLATSMVNLGQTGSNGLCQNDKTSTNGYPTVAIATELAAADEVALRRSSQADGTVQCTWEVIQWP